MAKSRYAVETEQVADGWTWRLRDLQTPDTIAARPILDEVYATQEEAEKAGTAALPNFPPDQPPR